MTKKARNLLKVGAIVASATGAVWYFGRRKKTETEIDADVYSPTFGLPIDRVIGSASRGAAGDGSVGKQ